MASPAQKRVLLGLQSGRKLHEVLQETQMPSQRMIQEWLDNPEFSEQYVQALAEGLRVRTKERLAVKKDFMEPTPVGPVPPTVASAIVIAAPEPQVVLPPTVEITYVSPGRISSVPPAVDEAALQQRIMTRLRAGENANEMAKNTPGFYAAKLAHWRRDATFVVEWNKARAIGQNVRKVDTHLIERLAPQDPSPAASFVTLTTEQVEAQRPSAYEYAFSEVKAPDSAPPIQPIQPPPAPDPAMEYLPEGMVRRYVVLKAEESYDYLMSAAEAEAIAGQDCASTGRPHYIVQVIAVAAPLTTTVLHRIG